MDLQHIDGITFGAGSETFSVISLESLAAPDDRSCPSSQSRSDHFVLFSEEPAVALELQKQNT